MIVDVVVAGVGIVRAGQGLQTGKEAGGYIAYVEPTIILQ